MLKTSTLIAVLMTTSLVSPFLPLNSVSAQFAQNYPPNYNNNSFLPAGTLIPVKYEASDKILIRPGETASVSLIVQRNITNNQGMTIIPAGSEIVGELQPVGNGAQFVATELIINNQWYSLDASSRVITTTENVKRGARTADIIMGTVAGAGAATIISGTTGDRKITPLEVLAGAAVGTLAGWGLPEAGIIGGGRETFISITPERDLTLTLQNPLNLGF